MSAATPPEPSDAALADLVGFGDHAASTELYEGHAEAVGNLAHRLTGSWTEADDLAPWLTELFDGLAAELRLVPHDLPALRVRRPS